MPETPEPLAGDLVAASEILGEVFDARGIRYAVLGGVATILRGRPRFTQDIDILLDVPQVALPGLLDELVARGFSLDRDTVMREFIQHHMAAFRFGVVRIDWLKPVLPLYAHALAAATSLPWTPGRSLRVLAPEGLVVTKLVAFRPQDQEDIRTLLAANRADIDAEAPPCPSPTCLPAPPVLAPPSCWWPSRERPRRPARSRPTPTRSSD